MDARWYIIFKVNKRKKEKKKKKRRQTTTDVTDGDSKPPGPYDKTRELYINRSICLYVSGHDEDASMQSNAYHFDYEYQLLMCEIRRWTKLCSWLKKNFFYFFLQNPVILYKISFTLTNSVSKAWLQPLIRCGILYLK